jgi:uncharacterized protein
MPEMIINGPSGRIETRYTPGRTANAPVAVILHPHPEYGGTMNNKVVFQTYKAFAERGFATMRFNFPGVGRSEGLFDGGEGELSVAATVLDWLQNNNPNAISTWISGFSFGSWIGMQLLMRRPEIRGFLSISPPANMFDFSFLAPCPTSGMIVMGERDEIVPLSSVDSLIEKIERQRGVTVDYRTIPDANHFFENKIDNLMEHVNEYINSIMAPDEMPIAV